LFNTFSHAQFKGVNVQLNGGNFDWINSGWGPRTLELGGKFIFKSNATEKTRQKFCRAFLCPLSLLSRDNGREDQKAMRIQVCLRRILFLILSISATAANSQAGKTLNSERQEALALEQKGDLAAAEDAWKSIARSAPNSPESWAHLGLIEARQQHYKEAVPNYRKALALNPGTPGLRMDMGLALFKGGEFKQAIVQFERLLNVAPQSSPEAQRLTILLGMSHYGLGEYVEAVPYLKEAAAADQENLQLRLALAHSCLWSKQYKCVLDTDKEILTIDPESAVADMLAGEAQDELKNADGAIAEFRAAVKANPKEPSVHFGLGYLLWTQRRYPEAIQEFEAELANDPNYAQATAYLADAEMQLNHPELALPLLEKVTNTDPGLALAHLDLGIVYTDGGQQADALRELNVAAKLDPDDVNVHWRLGRLLKGMGKKEEARAEFGKASSLHKATDDALLTKMNGAKAKPASSAEPAATMPQN
jgi:tetratricopeptide (TPR) repeat protein